MLFILIYLNIFIASLNDDVEMKDTEVTETAEEVPMMHLASFALHKLFSEWQAEGFEIPDFKAGGPLESVKAIKVWIFFYNKMS